MCRNETVEWARARYTKNKARNGVPADICRHNTSFTLITSSDVTHFRWYEAMGIKYEVGSYVSNYNPDG
jgi:hypothetical protein